MTSSSTEAAVVRGAAAERIVAFGAPRVRGDQWTRLADAGLRGDEVTEGTFTAVANAVHESARAQGYAVGWAAGRRDALAAVRAEAAEAATASAAQELIASTRREAEHAVALARLSEAAESFADGLARACDLVEERATAVAYALVAELLGRDAVAAPPADTARRALALLPPDGSGTMTVRVHPSVRQDDAAAALERAGARVVGDLTLDPTDIVVDFDEGTIDARIGTALDRLREAWEC